MFDRDYASLDCFCRKRVVIKLAINNQVHMVFLTLDTFQVADQLINSYCINNDFDLFRCLAVGDE